MLQFVEFWFSHTLLTQYPTLQNMWLCFLKILHPLLCIICMARDYEPHIGLIYPVTTLIFRRITQFFRVCYSRDVRMFPKRNWTNGCSKVQTVAFRPNNHKEFKQQRLKINVKWKTTLYSSYESRKNLDSLSLSITIRDTLNRICKTASKLKTNDFLKILKILKIFKMHLKMRKIRNYTTEIKLVTKQITYFSGVI